ncbi:MAG: tRNA-intron lyase [Nanoarchaeota archaeon]|nr:tRNA-intron lyase [Nanoarchaeota archaeon]|tara:strand:+ start:2691 stop:3248 length:558 start_codon:yes stop_codon:yes gene_type:complete
MVKKKEDIIELKKKIVGVLEKERVVGDVSNESTLIYDKSRFGERVGEKFQYSLVEGLFLLDTKRMNIKDGRGKKVKFDDFLKKARRFDKNFWVKYCVFKDMRSRGYVVKTALKFGAEFRVYGRGIKPGDDHAKWIVYPVHESNTTTWSEFAAKNRVAHSTRKRLLVGVVDDEAEVSYWEISWIRP